jgi:hypothetical protein
MLLDFCLNCELRQDDCCKLQLLQLNDKMTVVGFSENYELYVYVLVLCSCTRQLLFMCNVYKRMEMYVLCIYDNIDLYELLAMDGWSVNAVGWIICVCRYISLGGRSTGKRLSVGTNLYRCHLQR